MYNSDMLLTSYIYYVRTHIVVSLHHQQNSTLYFSWEVMLVGGVKAGTYPGPYELYRTLSGLRILARNLFTRAQDPPRIK